MPERHVGQAVFTFTGAGQSGRLAFKTSGSFVSGGVDLQAFDAMNLSLTISGGAVCYTGVVSEKDMVKRMLRGFRAAAVRQRELLQAEGPRPDQAVAEAIAAADALAEEGKWPGPRDPVNERAVERVRRRWVRIGWNAKQARQT